MDKTPLDFYNGNAEMLPQAFPKLSVEKQWITGDVRVGRGDERWMNVILKK